MRDLANSINIKRVFSPAAPITDNTALVGQIIDRQGAESLTYALAFGSMADADVGVTVLLEESDLSNMSGATAVADKDLLGTELLATPLFSDDDKVFKLGYIGNKRYTRLTVTPANNTGAFNFSAIAILGHLSLGPAPNPPA